MKNKLKLIVTIAVSIVILILLALPKLSSSGQTTIKQKTSDAPLQVKAHIIKKEKLANNIIVSGTVLANEEVELRSEVAGKITNIYFREGSNVRKGELLVKINDAELKAMHERAKYNLKLLETVNTGRGYCLKEKQ